MMEITEDIQLTRVSYKKGKVAISWLQQRPEDQTDEFSLVSTEQPTHRFVEALQALVPHVLRICELPDQYGNGITVLGVSFSHTNDVMGAVMTATKKLCHSTSPMLINTPHKPSEPYSGDDDSNCLDLETVQALQSVWDQALAYLRGDRAQMLLPFGDQETADEEAA